MYKTVRNKCIWVLFRQAPVIMHCISRRRILGDPQVCSEMHILIVRWTSATRRIKRRTSDILGERHFQPLPPRDIVEHLE